ncbi:thiamine phosphate synthase [Helicobacter sp. 11S02596-1]|uniref:thiamine phosphate synthase n=1 Tax=Helicobacter sp. 11S02596-1 TaxID=1476194 RepID=UPI000BA57DA7|nr:thiamine phosphate synthase [Helicobacter sp. 11S02596-1]PAF45010.1 hypothetical protein BJI48_00095 [Helicobacter sp. 11S02596-1]
MIPNPKTTFESYFITSPLLYPELSPIIFKQRLENIFQSHSIQKACFRDSTQEIPAHLIKVFSQTCDQYNIESFINLANTPQSLQYCQKYKLSGIHIKGNELSQAKNLPKTLTEQKIKTFYSAHHKTEVSQALDLGIDFVTISPIFFTPNKPNPLGISYLDSFDSECKAHLFALGGILTQEQIDAIKSKGLKGFASIRYFLDARF